MVARDWRGGKVFYREWSKLGVERTLAALNDEGSWEESAPEYWKASRLSPVSPGFRPRFPGFAVHGGMISQRHEIQADWIRSSLFGPTCR